MSRADAEVVRRLLDLQSWQVFDVDSEGNILAGNDASGSLQLVELGPDGSRTPLTALPSRCSGRYVPGSQPRQVIVEHDTGGDERMQLSMITLDDLAAPCALDDLTPVVRDPAYMHVLQDVTVTSIIYSTNRRNGVDMDVIVRDLADGSERVLYDGGGYVADVVVSHDERSVAVTALSLRPASTRVFLAGERAGAVTDPDELALHTQVGWTGDDDALIMSSNHGLDMRGIYRVNLDGGDWELLNGSPDHEIDLWVAPSGAAWVEGHRSRGMTALAICRTGAEPVSVPTDEIGVPNLVWAPDSSCFALHQTSDTDPGSIFLVDAATGAATRLVDGRDQLRDLTPSRPEVTTVPTPDDERVPCFMYRPWPGAAPKLAGASVLHVHGGPEGEAARPFHPVVQSLCASGFTVLVPNVRGSAGYGKRWVGLDDVDKRLDSVADLAAVHAWLPRLGLDPARSALWGGSYGGYMVLAGLSMQPQLWAGGVDIVGISSLVTFLQNTSPYRRAYREREYGSLEHDRDFLIKASPLTYLDQLRAPLFVIHGANDPRVPLSEAEQIVAALRERHVPCELRVYADEGHGLAKRANRQDAYPAAIAFLAEALGR